MNDQELFDKICQYAQEGNKAALEALIAEGVSGPK
jgi:hypothetical protein